MDQKFDLSSGILLILKSLNKIFIVILNTKKDLGDYFEMMEKSAGIKYIFVNEISDTIKDTS
jgi:hypothetical protein